jgi:hypothetical protein
MPTVIHGSLGENLPERQALDGEIVVAQGSCLVGVVEHHDPPRARRVLLGAGEAEIGIDTPGGGKVPVYLSLKSRNRVAYLVIRQYGARVDELNFDGAILPGSFPSLRGDSVVNLLSLITVARADEFRMNL